MAAGDDYKQTFYIDKLTNSIELRISGKNFDTDVIRLMSDDLKTILKKHGWRFNWRLEFKQQDRQLFKLIVKMIC